MSALLGTMKKIPLVSICIVLVIFCFFIQGCAAEENGGDVNAESSELSEYKDPIEADTDWVLTRKSQHTTDAGAGLYKVWQYEYSDDEGSVTEIKAMADEPIDDPVAIDHTVLVHTYDENGNVNYEKVTEIDESGRITETAESYWEYYEEDKPSSLNKTTQTLSNVEVTTEDFTYDENGNLIAHEVLTKAGDVISEQYVTLHDLTYDDNQKIIQEVQERSDNGDRRVVTREYDEANRLAREQVEGQRDGQDVVTIQEFSYDDKGNTTFEHTLNLINNETQADASFSFDLLYDDKARLVAKVQSDRKGDGYYYHYDDRGRKVEEITVRNGQVLANTVDIYDANGLKLISFEQPLLHTYDHLYQDVTTYEYENRVTGEIVSGSLYEQSKYHSNYSVDYPAPSTTLIDYPSLYSQLTGSPFEGDTFDEASSSNLKYDESVNTDPTKLDIKPSTQPLTVETKYYSFIMPDLWKGKVAYNVIDTSTYVYLSGYKQAELFHTAIDDDAGDVGNGYIFILNKPLPNGRYFHLYLNSWELISALYPAEKDFLLSGMSPIQQDAIVDELISLSTGGEMSSEDADGVAEALTLGNMPPSAEFIESSIMPTVKQ